MCMCRGHACQEEQKLVLTLAKPQFFIPARRIQAPEKHAQTAVAVGVPEQNVYIGENGNCIILEGRHSRRRACRRVPCWWMALAWDVGNVVMRDRRHLGGRPCH